MAFFRTGMAGTTEFTNFVSAEKRSGQANLTVPQGCTKGILICIGNTSNASPQTTNPSGNGIKTIDAIGTFTVKNGAYANATVGLYNCTFNEGGTISYSCNVGTYQSFVGIAY